MCTVPMLVFVSKAEKKSNIDGESLKAMAYGAWYYATYHVCY